MGLIDGRRFGRVVPVGLPIAVVIVILLGSAFVPGGRQEYGSDSGMFAYVGWAWQEGRVPYLGAWDNKGPLLYAINLLGLGIAWGGGVFALEAIFLVGSAVLAWRLGCLFTGPWLAAIAASAGLCGVVMRVGFQAAGDCRERGALRVGLDVWRVEHHRGMGAAFCLAICFVVARFFRGKNVRGWEVFIAGVCAGAIVMLRANILAVPGVFLTVAAGILIIRRQGRRLGRWALLLVGGVGAVVVPFIVYFAAKGALAACWEAAYGGVVRWKTTLSEQVASVPAIAARCEPRVVVVIVFVVLLGWVRAAFRRHSGALGPLPLAVTLGLVVNLVANALSGRAYPHYWTTFIPLVVIMAAVCAEWCLAAARRIGPRLGRWRWPCAVIVGIFILAAFLPAARVAGANAVANFRGADERWTTCVDFIESHSAPGDTIQVFGYGGAGQPQGWYFATRRLSASRYPYTPMNWWTREAREAMDIGIAGDVLRNRPALLISSPGSYDRFVAMLSPQLRREVDALVTAEYVQAAVPGADGVVAYVRRA